jgi:Mce-associated membrane protein
MSETKETTQRAPRRLRGAGQLMARRLRPFGRLCERRAGAVTAALAAAVVMLGAGVFLLWQHVNNYTTISQDSTAALAAAQTDAVTILSYNYATIGGDTAKAEQDLTGKFRQQYTGLVNQEVIPAAEQRHISSQTHVVGGSVVHAQPGEVTVLLFLNQTVTALSLKTPSLTGSRVRMVMNKVGPRWLVSQLTPL